MSVCLSSVCILYMLLACRWAQSCSVICLSHKHTEGKTKLPHHTEAPHEKPFAYTMWVLPSNEWFIAPAKKR